MKILSEMCPDYFELVCPDIILRVVRICPVYFERCCISYIMQVKKEFDVKIFIINEIYNVLNQIFRNISYNCFTLF